MGIRSARGDNTYTELFSCKGVSKDCLEVQAIGDIDELISHLGLVKARVTSRREKAMLEKVQHDLLVIASEISVGPGKKKELGAILKDKDADWISNTILRLERRVRLKNSFYLPGEGEVSALLDIARAVARRAERSVVTLVKKEKVKFDSPLMYLNCVSDLLFIMAREKGERERKKNAR